jgi:hypothetical protein
MLSNYLVNWNDRKDASVYTGGKRYKVVIESMAEGKVVETKWFSGAYASHKANQFAARTLGLNDELAKLVACETSCREYNAEVTKSMREMVAQFEGSEFGDNLKAALAARDRIGL